MPPQQGKGLLDFVDDGCGLGAHLMVPSAALRRRGAS